MKNRWALIIHLYGGTLVTFYLLMIGISAFHFNHHLPFFESKTLYSKEYKKKFTQKDSAYTAEVLDKINEEIGIFGHMPWWEQHTDSLGNFCYKVSRPGRDYFITIPKEQDSLMIKECCSGMGCVFVSLHTLSIGRPLSKITFIWRIASIVFILATFIIVCLSFYLWYTRSFKRKRQWIFIGIIGILSLSFILYAWLIG